MKPTICKIYNIIEDQGFNENDLNELIKKLEILMGGITREDIYNDLQGIGSKLQEALNIK